jgi:hypothetical protein
MMDPVGPRTSHRARKRIDLNLFFCAAVMPAVPIADFFRHLSRSDEGDAPSGPSENVR